MVVPSLSLVLPNIRSCHNVGAMFRTADAFGFEKLWLCGYTAHPPKIQIDKVSLGAETWIPWEHHADPIACLTQLKEANVYLIGLEKTETSTSLYNTNLPLDRPVALVVGNEVTGVEPDVLPLLDAVVHIPMHGKKESLNVSVAAGVAMSEVRRQLLSS
jgi:tRNA G18 (ribose-2'-O)-methylase SpoU